MTADIRFIYVTASGPEEVDRIVSALLQQRLAACVNILPGMRSAYWWQGKIERADETVLIVKTRAELVDEVTTAIKKLHSYSNPCVAALTVTGGSPEFLDWIANECGTTSS